MGSEAPQRRRRLSRSGDFDRVYRDGRSHSNRYLVLYAFPRAEGAEDVRLGVSVGRRVGGAVERNAVKRGINEAFWATAASLPCAHDVVVVARPEVRGLLEREGTGGLAPALGELLAAAGLAGGRKT